MACKLSLKGPLHNEKKEVQPLGPKGERQTEQFHVLLCWIRIVQKCLQWIYNTNRLSAKDFTYPLIVGKLPYPFLQGKKALERGLFPQMTLENQNKGEGMKLAQPFCEQMKSKNFH